MKNNVLGIDIGGSKIRVVVLSSSARWNGKVLMAREIKTPVSLEAFKGALRSLIVWGQCGRVGIAVPGRIKKNVFVSATNIPYIKNLNFKKIFQYLNIKMDHDARCFARAEYQDKRITLFLTLGTGVGRAVTKNGRISRIKKFEYPEKWENEYKKIRDKQDDLTLAKFLAEKLKNLLKAYDVKLIIVGGGVSTRKGFLGLLRKKVGLPIKKARFGKNSVAIGAAMLF